MSSFIFVLLALNVILLGIHVDAYHYNPWRVETWTPPDTSTSCYCKDRTKEPVRMFTSTGADGRGFMACVTKQTCYKVCDAPACVTYTVKCIDRATVTSKPGLCPTHSFPSKTILKGKECTKDSDCSERKKCCLLSSKESKQCIEPIGSGSKCGTCIEFPGCFINYLWNEKSCTKDAECRDSWKCCPCGSSKKCHSSRPPYHAAVALSCHG